MSRERQRNRNELKATKAEQKLFEQRRAIVIGLVSGGVALTGIGLLANKISEAKEEQNENHLKIDLYYPEISDYPVQESGVIKTPTKPPITAPKKKAVITLIILFSFLPDLS